uniref:GIY-YIG domain-containing protein n=1 Tax=Angiostrongylus cantonensis TaxID=6313 RepID=A0A0K0D5Q8_ANGCA
MPPDTLRRQLVRNRLYERLCTIYLISGSTCGVEYIGETGRPPRIRIKEHLDGKRKLGQSTTLGTDIVQKQSGGDFNIEANILVGEDGMECKTEANVKAMLDTLEKSNKVKCNDTEGEERDSGVEWQDGSIQYKCDENGEVAFVGCLTSTGELIPLGE